MTNCPDIIWYDTVDSTNKLAEKMLRKHPEPANLSVIAARFQTAGRGQGDHTWTSERGGNLTFSMILGREICGGLKTLQDINDMICPVLCEWLGRQGLEDVWVKQPNDIFVADRKICGILVENIFQGGKIIAGIIGVGLNLNQTRWPDNLPNPVSLKELTGKNYKPEDVLSELVEMFCKKNLENVH